MWIITFIAFAVVFTTALTPCKRLHEKYSGPLRAVRIEGEDHEIKVVGAGGLARAESALLLAIIRHAHRYVARLDPTEANFCDLTATTHSSVIIAPAAILNSEGCGLEKRTVDPYVSFNAPASPPINLHLMAYIPTCSKQSKLRNDTLMLNCDIIPNQFSDITSNTLLIRNESSHDNYVLAKFVRRAVGVNPLITFKSFDNDSSFRRELYRLRNINETFIFIDENLWSNIPNVYYLQPPPCLNDDSTCVKDSFDLTNAVRIGDGNIVRRYAPVIYKNLIRFSPDIKTLRDILQYESSSEDLDIEEAACQWAIDNQEKFNKLIETETIEKSYFNIMIFLCKDDPFNKYYERVAHTTLKHLNQFESIQYKLFETLVNCNSSNDLRWGIKKLSSMKSVAGAVAWSWDAGLLAASDFDQYLEIPLKLAGPVSDRVNNQATYASSSRFSYITRAYRFFLSKCGWTRLAIISDETVYSKDFVDAIISHGKLNYRNGVVSENSTANYLEELKNDDARIFIVNTNCKLANDILLKAQKMFVPSNNYIWIVREWCLFDKNDNISLVHYSIDFAWRGGITFKGSQKLRDDLVHIPNITLECSLISPGVSYLADALLLLGHGFSAYYHGEPFSRYDLYGKGSSIKYARAVSALNIPGVAQALNMENNSLNNPLIYVEKWHGNDRRTMAVWRVDNSSVIELWAVRNDPDECIAILGAARILDAGKCFIASRNKFAPDCYDLLVFILCASIIIIGIIIYILYKRFKKRLSNYNKSLLAEILENRHENASSLAKYLVNRAAIKLMHEIGSGCYGRVYFAELNQPGQETLVVAAKELHERMTTQEQNEFLQEACVLARLEHSNVIKLMGVCLGKGSPLMLMEHAIYLDLIRYLTERKHMVVQARQEKLIIDELESVTETDMTKWAIEAASALEYLGLRRLVHRDVRAANCLLDKNRSLKLADFGLARELDVEYPVYMSHRKAMFPVLWMAPESLEAGVFGLASDIWALGVLILEIAMMGGRPFGNWPASHVMRFVIRGGSPPFPPDTPLAMRNILQKCWRRKPEQRITASEIKKELMQNPKIISPTLLLPELPATKEDNILSFVF